jgi:spermine oxidase
MQFYDTIVIGAGIAGLGAGKTIFESNGNFMILEGSDRVGGRINTVELQSTDSKIKVDAGAQWLHGKDNELFKFTEMSKLIREELSEEAEGDYAFEDGTKIDEFFVKKVDFKFGEILTECEQLVAKKDDKNFKFPKSMAEFVEKRFISFFDRLVSEERTLALQLLDWHRRFVS